MERMTRGGGGGKAEEQGKVMGPLFPRLHVSDAVKSGGPRAPPRNKMALYEQFTVPSNRFSSSASTRAGGGSLVSSTSASQVYGYDRPLFQPFDVPSIEPARSSERIKGNSIKGQSNSTRRESGRLSSQTKNNDAYAARSIAECTSQHRVGSGIKNSSGKKMANDDEFMVPSICSPRFPQHSIHGHAGVQEKSVQVEEMSTSIQSSKDKFSNKDAKLCSKRDMDSDINSSDNPHIGNNGRQHASMNGSSMKGQNPTTKNTVSSKQCTDLDNCNQNSNLLDGSLRRIGAKRKWSLGHHDVEQNDDLSDSSVECIPGWEISPDEVIGAIGPKHFWKTRRAIQNQQRVFAVQVFELHRLVKVQKLIAASPHLLIEGDPCLGNILAGKKNKLPKGNLEAQTLTITNKDDVQLALEQQELSTENTEGKMPSPSRDDGLGGNHHDQAATNEAFASNSPATTACPDNKQNNWCLNPPQNQWLIPVMSPSEGLVYKPYTGLSAPVGSLLAPFYANCTPLRRPSTTYGVPMPHQAQHMAPAMSMNYNCFPPFSLPAAALEQGSHAAVSQPNGHVEQQSHISCNMSHPSGIWRFHASRDSEPQGSSASSSCDRLQGDGSGPVSFFPAASVQNAQPQPSSGSRDKQSHVIRVVPHNGRTASESAARIFRSIQMERQQSD
uniref:Uncharacterized protein n=1 Tax=Arundo donax TaxID=35708 RepID=A0A0A9D1I9_ARUDO